MFPCPVEAKKLLCWTRTLANRERKEKNVTKNGNPFDKVVFKIPPQHSYKLKIQNHDNDDDNSRAQENTKGKTFTQCFSTVNVTI